MIVRAGTADDAVALNRIYNHYVRGTAITFDLEPLPEDARSRWLEQFGPTGPHRILVADDGGVLRGYACSHVFRPRGAYATSVETTVYVDAEHAGKGIGTALYGALFDALTGEDVHRAYAGITLPNEASLALHRRFGFTEIGTFHEVGRKLGRYWSVCWLEKRLG